MQARSLTILPQAQADISRIIAYLDAERPGLGSIFLDEIRKTHDRILDHPESYQRFRAKARRAVIRRFRYSMIYRIRGNVIEIIAVLHQKRHPRAAQSRL